MVGHNGRLREASWHGPGKRGNPGCSRLRTRTWALSARALPGHQPFLPPFYAEAQFRLPFPRLPLSLGCSEVTRTGLVQPTQVTQSLGHCTASICTYACEPID